MKVNKQQIAAFKDSYRAQFVNSLAGFKSANLIGTMNTEGKNNLLIVSSVTHLGANPPLIGFVIGPNEIARATLTNILSTEEFSINQVSGSFWQQAHQTSKNYPRGECEFESVGIEKEFIDGINVPFVAESSLKYSLKLKEIVEIESNKAQLVIGEITNVILNEHALKEDGYIDIETLHAVTISGADSYHVTQLLSRANHNKSVDHDDDFPDWF
ncbi:MAG: flavin reductase family protein [Thalassotalea sp.]